MKGWRGAALLAGMLVLSPQAGFAMEVGGEEGGHGHGHVPTLDEINWWHGFLGESEEAQPSLLWRKPGTPVPLGAMLLNTGLLFLLIVKLGGPKLSEALRARKQGITAGMQQAAEMREEAKERLKEYEEKLAKVDEQIEHAKRQIRDLAKAERQQVLNDAREKRERMERDAKLLISQELKAARDLLMEETIRKAVAAARQVLAEQATQADEHRLQDEYLASVRSAKLNVRGQA